MCKCGLTEGARTTFDLYVFSNTAIEFGGKFFSSVANEFMRRILRSLRELVACCSRVLRWTKVMEEEGAPAAKRARPEIGASDDEESKEGSAEVHELS